MGADDVSLVPGTAEECAAGCAPGSTIDGAASFQAGRAIAVDSDGWVSAFDSLLDGLVPVTGNML